MESQFEKLVRKYLSGKCSEEERAFIEDWYNQLSVSDEQALLAWNLKKETLKHKVFKKIKAHKDTKVRTLVFIRTAAAAVLVVILGLIYNLNLTDEQNTKQNLLNYATTQNSNISELKNTRLIADENNFDLKGYAGIEYKEGIVLVKSDSKIGISQLITDKESYSTLLVPYGRRADIVLSDGTKVLLNSGSKLVYPNSFSGNKREVYLSGEAYFEVSHNKEKPFHVYAKEMDVKVLGTSFNVRAYVDEKDVSTTLVNGSVELSPDKIIKDHSGEIISKKVVKLSPGRMAVYEHGLLTHLNTVDTDIYTSWRLGYLHLKNEPLNNLLKNLERYYNVSLVLEAGGDSRNFSGRLNLEDDLKDVIEIIALTTGYNLERVERGWLLKHKENQL